MTIIDNLYTLRVGFTPRVLSMNNGFASIERGPINIPLNAPLRTCITALYGLEQNEVSYVLNSSHNQRRSILIVVSAVMIALASLFINPLLWSYFIIVTGVWSGYSAYQLLSYTAINQSQKVFFEGISSFVKETSGTRVLINEYSSSATKARVEDTVASMFQSSQTSPLYAYTEHGLPRCILALSSTIIRSGRNTKANKSKREASCGAVKLHSLSRCETISHIIIGQKQASSQQWFFMVDSGAESEKVVNYFDSLLTKKWTVLDDQSMKLEYVVNSMDLFVHKLNALKTQSLNWDMNCAYIKG